MSLGVTMIEISESLQQALDSQDGLVRIVDARTGDEYVVVRAEFFEKMQKLVAGFTRSAGWDDPRLDVYEEYRDK
jgi:hypothetical protein